MRHLLLAGAALLGMCGVAEAGQQDFKLVNKTGYQIDEVYVSAATSRSWGGDIMGRGTLDADGTVDVTFNAPDNVCRWDLRVKYEDGDTAEWGNLNLCNIESVTLFWDRKNQTTRAVTR